MCIFHIWCRSDGILKCAWRKYAYIIYIVVSIRFRLEKNSILYTIRVYIIHRYFGKLSVDKSLVSKPLGKSLGFYILSYTGRARLCAFYFRRRRLHKLKCETLWIQNNIIIPTSYSNVFYFRNFIRRSPYSCLLRTLYVINFHSRI